MRNACHRRLLAFAAACLLAVAASPAPAAPSGPDKSGVGPSAVSLPSGSGSIAGFGASYDWSVNGNKGGFRYAVSLRTPTGPAGQTVALQIGYGSDFPADVLGQGWRLSLPSIERDTADRLPVPKALEAKLAELVPGSATFRNELGERLRRADDGYFYAEYERRFVRYRQLDRGWQAHLPSGERIDFGVTPGARIESDDGSHIFRWLPERAVDLHGNEIRYTYRASSVTTRTAAVPRRLIYRIEYGAGAPPWDVRHVIIFRYEPRPDRLLDGRPGFLVETGERLAVVDVAVAGAPVEPGAMLLSDGDGGPVQLVRRYRFEYAPTTRVGGVSLLAAIVEVGRDGRTELPPVRFGYSSGNLPDGEVDASSAITTTFPRGIGSLSRPAVEIVDVNADALPDLIEVDGAGSRAHRAYLNLGPGSDEAAGVDAVSFSPPAAMTGDPQSRNIVFADLRADAGFADYDGDGRADLSYRAPSDRIYFFPNRGTVGWGDRRELGGRGSLPSRFSGRKDVRQADLDGDRRIDLVQSFNNGRWLRVWYCLDGDRYSQPVDWSCSGGCDFVGGAQLTDVTGDGQVDFVHLKRTTVEVRPGLGFGALAPLRLMALPTGSLSSEDMARARIVDVTGDGLADLLVGPDDSGRLRLSVNHGGARFGGWIDLRGVPRALGNRVKVRWADINGDGATDYVLLDDTTGRPTVRILDFVAALGGRTKPNLLVSIDNGRGQRLDVAYSTAARLAARARNEGQAWATTSPIPVSLVDELSVSIYPREHPSVRQYRYFDSIYSEAERTHHGFQTVEVMDFGHPTSHETSPHPGLITRTQYDRGDTDPSRRGAALQELLLTADGLPLIDRRTSWNEPPRNLRFRGRTAVSIYSHPTAELTRVFDEAGVADDLLLLQRMAYDDFGNLTRLEEFGEVDESGTAVHPDAVRVRVADHLVDEGAWLLRLPRRERVLGGDGVPVAETRYHYDDETFNPVLGVSPTRGLLTMTRVHRTPETGDSSDPEAWLVEKRQRYDAFGNPVLTLGPLARIDAGGNPIAADGHFAGFDIDPLFRNRPVAERIVVDAETTIAHRFEYDLGFETVSSYLDPSGAETRYGYDSLGRIVSIAQPHDRPSRPSTRFSYGVGEPTADGGAISWIETRFLDASEASVDADAYLASRRYLDGAGRAVYTVGPGTGGVNGDASAVITGIARFSSRGSLLEALTPCAESDIGAPKIWRNPFAPGWTCDWLIDGTWQRLALADAPATLRRYDARDREIETVTPDGAVRRMHRSPRETRLEDENFVAEVGGAGLTMRYDGFGRVVEMIETPRIADDGRVTSDRRAWITRFAYDAQDRLVAVRDSAGRLRSAAFDGPGRLVRTESPDFGTIRLAYDDESNLVEQVDAAGRTSRFVYDGANRLVAAEATAADAAPVTTRYVYDVRRPGRLSRIDDDFGTEELFYDDRGRLTEARRQVSAALGGGVYSIASDYDPMDRLVSKTFPDGDRMTLEYGPRGLLVGVRMASVGPLVTDAAYAPDEQPVSIAFANGLDKRFAYDERGRLTATEVGRDGQAPLFSELLDHDPASNIVRRERWVAGSRSIETFAHDDLHRLIAAARNGPDGTTTWGYRYDRLGSLLAATIDGSPATPSIKRDESGRALGLDDLSFGWDAEGRLATASTAVAKLRNVYAYDGRRVIRQIAGEDGTDEFLSPFADYEIGDGRAVKLVSVLGALGATVETPESTGPPKVRFHHTDHLKSPILRFDETGNLVGETVLAPFGNLHRIVGEAAAGRGITGAHLDTGFGLTRFEARSMHSATGRFLSPDPVLLKLDAPPGSPQALNPFSYSANRPLTHSDPEGRIFSLAVTAGFAAYDSYQYAVGNIGAGEYAAAMALNGAALIADIATAGTGGGLAVRAGNFAIKASKGVTRADTLYSAGNAAFHAANSARNGNYGEALVMGGVATLGFRQSRSAIANRSGETTVLYRGVSAEEYNDVMRIGGFRPNPSGGSFGSKQFGFDLDEIYDLTNRFPETSAILKVELPTKTLRKIGDFTPVDQHILKSGSVTIHGNQLDSFNSCISSICNALD